MRQYEAVIKTMEENGGYATLKYLYEKALKIPGVEWKTKTPYASIRRIVQDQRFFFKIRPGLWALKSYRNRLPSNITKMIEESKKPIEQTFTHYYYQGMIAEIGNLYNFKVHIPSQDKNKPFLDKKLKDVTTMENLPNFTYDDIIRNIRSIDVIWMNERGFPYAVFEVEHSTNFKNSLNKFYELIDFYTKMIIVSDKQRKHQFDHILNSSIYKSLKDRVIFCDYEYLESYYSNPFQFKGFLQKETQ